MLAELQLELNCEELSFRQSSNLHGLIMEKIAPGYAEVLHMQSLNPFSQCLIQDKERKIWNIRTLSKEAYEEIIIPLQQINTFDLKKGQLHATITEKRLKTIAYEELLEFFYQPGGEHYFDLTFQTPTSFKSNQRYVIYPDLRLIYQSLMNRYSAIDSEMDMRDEDTLEQLAEHSEIIRYRLKSTQFPLERTVIPSYQGNIVIRVTGTDTMARYARLLFMFGEYAGVGIKTGLGMGAVKLGERRTGSDRQRD